MNRHMSNSTCKLKALPVLCPLFAPPSNKGGWTVAEMMNQEHCAANLTNFTMHIKSLSRTAKSGIPSALPCPHHARFIYPRMRHQSPSHAITASAMPVTAATITSPGASAATTSTSVANHGPLTLSQFLTKAGTSTDMVLLMQAIQTASKVIASKVARAGIEGDLGAVVGSSDGTGRDAQKALDVVANEVLKSQLATSGLVGVMASEEEDAAVVLDEHDRSKYVVVFDPLDGSSNISASIPTGTIFGVYQRTSTGSADADILQAGSQLVAAGYTLYSSATMLVVSVGSGTHGFTLDPQVGEFVLTHPSIKVPQRGQYYSLNDARQFDWPEGLQKYINDIRQGKGQSGKQYSARYVCSLVADFHRTLLYGGWAANPRDHLRLVYEANPLAYLSEQAEGKGTDGVKRIMDITPTKLHQRLPLFLGSPLDIDELHSYKDVQQVSTKKYEV